MLNASPTGILGNANTREKTMKSILLASASVVAFAGAASAAGHSSITFSGEASATYNSLTDLTLATEVTATASVAMNNGITAGASVTIDGVAGTVSAGSVSLSSDMASITFGSVDSLANAAYVGEAMFGQTVVAGIIDGDKAAKDAEVRGTVSMSGINVVASMNSDGTGLALGASTTMSGFDVAVGYDNDTSTFGGMVAGNAGGIDVTAMFGSGSSWAVKGATSVAGADVYAIVADGNEWEVGGSVVVGDITLGATYDDNSDYTISADYAAGAIAVGVDYDGTNFDVEGSYDFGGGLVAYAGSLANNATYYVGAEYDLGNGASVLASYNTGADKTGARKYLNGTTVKVSFEF
jgi:hypothetical protein